MRKRAALLPLVLAALCACSGKSESSAQTPQPSPTPLIAARGVVMPLTQAVRKIHFAPFIPSAQMLSVAVIPPLSDADGKRDPGLAIEYESDGDALLLSQWPRDGFDIAVGAFDATRRPCAPVAYQADGLLWTTRNGRVMTLQPDGVVLPARITREAGRLLRAGACGRRAKTPPRPLPSRRSPSASSPRRSVF